MSPRLSLLVVLALLFTGCANTKIVSQRDPAIPVDMYSIIMVDASLSSLAETQEAERGIADALERRGYAAFPEDRLFFAQNEYSPEEVEATMVENGVEAILVVTLQRQGYDSEYVPAKFSTETRVSETDEEYKEVTKTTYQPPNTVETAWANYIAELYDRETGKLVWYAEIESEGSGFLGSMTGTGQDHSDLARSAAAKVADRLVQDNLLRRVVREETPVEKAEFKPRRLRSGGGR